MVGCNRQDFDWAVSLLHSRCFIQGPQSIHMTVPGVDMANHSFSPNAAVRCRLCFAGCCSITHSDEMQQHIILSLAVLLGGARCCALSLICLCPVLYMLVPCSALPCTCPASAALLCPALPCPALPCPALPCPALRAGLVIFGATVTGMCIALRPVKDGKQKKMCVTPLQHSLPCFSCCQDLMASGKLLLSPAPLHQMACHNGCMSGIVWGSHSAQCLVALASGM